MSEKNSDVGNSIKIVKIHFFYVSFILIGVVILLCTYKWTEVEGFTNYIGVAATITSLVLGILAIIYSFVSSGATNQFLGSIESSANSIREIGGKLGLVVEGGQELQIKAQSRNEELHSIIGDLRRVIDSVSSRTAEIAGAVETFPNHFLELKQQMNFGKIDERGPIPAPENVEVPIDSALKFIRNTSTSGLLIYKALSDAKLMNKYCDLSKSFSDNIDYVFGFLTASSDFENLGIEFYKDKDVILKEAKVRLLSFNQALADAISAELASREVKMDAGERSYMQGWLRSVEGGIFSISEIEKNTYNE